MRDYPIKRVLSERKRLMTVGELIAHLQQFPADAPVGEYKPCCCAESTRGVHVEQSQLEPREVPAEIPPSQNVGPPYGAIDNSARHTYDSIVKGARCDAQWAMPVVFLGLEHDDY